MIGLGSAYGILLVMFTIVHKRSFCAQIVLTLFVFYHHASPHCFGFAISFAIIDGGKSNPFLLGHFGVFGGSLMFSSCSPSCQLVVPVHQKT